MTEEESMLVGALKKYLDTITDIDLISINHLQDGKYTVLKKDTARWYVYNEEKQNIAVKNNLEGALSKVLYEIHKNYPNLESYDFLHRIIDRAIIINHPEEIEYAFKNSPTYLHWLNDYMDVNEELSLARELEFDSDVSITDESMINSLSIFYNVVDEFARKSVDVSMEDDTYYYSINYGNAYYKVGYKKTGESFIPFIKRVEEYERNSIDYKDIIQKVKK